ncbi:HlyD family efflux transporter periplasmic adaptor subunit [Brenneria tiliae]|uniref:HlyD family secretion protein n=1 Tax=Brenneria tiliae TaxID=2914984 RepID=A0ABT0MNK2_9GAMM|nr:HlyD family efflux transporter periplasmic adaptor subunit [Brenneria tiliae]MCL2891414.1 HlyD family secretion protein [Brenneria tiliae]
MSKVDTDSDVGVELHKDYALIIRATIFILTIAIALSFVVTIKKRVVLNDAIITTAPEPLFFYAEKDMEIQFYNIKDGGVVKKGERIYKSINPELEENEALLLQQISEDETKIKVMEDHIADVYEQMNIEKKYEDYKYNKNQSELKNIDVVLKEHNHDYDIFNKNYEEESAFVNKLSNYKDSYLSKSDVIEYKTKLFSSRSDLIDLKSAISNLEKRKYSLEDEQNRYVVGVTRYKELDMDLNKLKGELDVLVSGLNVKKTKIDNIKANKLRIEGIAKVDGKVEFNNVNSIRPTQVKRGALIFTIYPEGNYFIAKGIVDERYIRDIKIGQLVELKMDAYNYLKYGAIKGEVETVFNVKNGTAEVVINILDKNNFELEFGNAIRAFIILDEINLLEYMYEIIFPYVA